MENLEGKNRKEEVKKDNRKKGERNGKQEFVSKEGWGT
jgi:hypothetical protein